MKKITLSKILPFLILTAIAAASVFIPASESFKDSGRYNSSDMAWILTATALVFLMTPGLAFFYGGMVHRKKGSGLIFHCTGKGIIRPVYSGKGF